MRLLVDENVPRATVQALTGLGHDVRDLRGTADQGMTDEALWALAQLERRLLISTDKASSMVDERDHFGVLIVRLRQPNRRRIQDRVLQALTRFPDQQQWSGMVVTMRDYVQTVRRSRAER